MTYSVNKATIYGLVEKEMSLAADEAYGDNGASLYDVVALTSKDEDWAKQYIDDALALLLRQMRGDATLSGTTLTITAPDMDATNSTEAQSEITRYLALSSITEVMQTRRPALVPQYAARTQAALSNVISITRNRTTPTRS